MPSADRGKDAKQPSTMDTVEEGDENSSSSLLIDEDDDGGEESQQQSSREMSPLITPRQNYSCLLTCLVLILGIAMSGAFIGMGITDAHQEERDQFVQNALNLVNKIKLQFSGYVTAANSIHYRCRHRNFTRTDFRELYEYLVADGLDFQAIQFDPYVPREERAAAEAEARAYYSEHYPHVNYRGFVGFETEIPSHLEPRSEQDFYFPIHYMEPINGNEAAIDLDYYSHISRRRTLESCLDTGKPAVTDRLVLVTDSDVSSRCGTPGIISYGVVLMHPGTDLTTTEKEQWPRDLSSIVICIPALLEISVKGRDRSAVYIYDASDSSGEMAFLGGVELHDEVPAELEHGHLRRRLPYEAPVTHLSEVPIEELRHHHLYREEQVQVTNKVWKIVVVDLDDSYSTSLIFVIFGGIITFVASVGLALWIYNNNKLSQMKAKADAEKAALVLKNAQQAAEAERELNDFIAHEVRNPISAAMTACIFVKTAVSQNEPIRDEESLQSIRDDVDIIDKSLRFVNDLLRNMLDMHRAADKQLHLRQSPTDVFHDILEPVAGMLLDQHGDYIDVGIDCPSNLSVVTDSLRLKQVLLNLGRNSRKFVTKGFIRLRAYEKNGNVELSVDDSGPGIPAEKQERLFLKFQESLDTLSQGTGIGLFLCKNLVTLMGGEIYLDLDYDSGIESFPGTRFVINLKTPPLDMDDDLPNVAFDRSEETSSPNEVGELVSEEQETGCAQRPKNADSVLLIPEEISVLFVDDDAVLRKLFSRSIQKVFPRWKVRESANGETALRLVEEETFDVIFMDMYMASVEKQLLGTETVAEMRSRGIRSRICGLSANDTEAEFLKHGADAFLLKPFPCQEEALRKELHRVLYCDRTICTN